MSALRFCLSVYFDLSPRGMTFSPRSTGTISTVEPRGRSRPAAFANGQGMRLQCWNFARCCALYVTVIQETSSTMKHIARWVLIATMGCRCCGLQHERRAGWPRGEHRCECRSCRRRQRDHWQGEGSAGRRCDDQGAPDLGRNVQGRRAAERLRGHQPKRAGACHAGGPDGRWRQATSRTSWHCATS